MEITFIAALQHLPARQRAVLVLRDVLGFSANETAAMLDTSVDAVKSALNRARKALAAERPPRLPAAAPQSGTERRLLERFVQAFVADDIDAMVALLTEHAWIRMPPSTLEYRGPVQIRALLAAVSTFRAGQPMRALAARANHQPAYGLYRADHATGPARPVGLLLVSLAGQQIAALTWFVRPTYLGALGLPEEPLTAPSAETPGGS